MKVEFYRHSVDEVDVENAIRVLGSTFLTTGPVTAEFERRFSAFTGLAETVGLTSCTAALHLGLLALGVGAGDEVVTTPMTFIATATAILHTGARPVFADVEPATGLIDPERVERAITPRTRAILPVHLYGCMADMRALRAIADRRGLRVLEDCAHCIEGERDGVRPGQLGDAACYSFYATKNLTCGEGGALASDDPALAARVRRLRLHGMSVEAADRHHGRYQHWDMVELGWKYNMYDLQAALLVDQLDRLPALHARRAAICRAYDAAVAEIPGIETPEPRGRGAHHLYTIWVDPEIRDDFLHALQEEGVGVTVNYRAVHSLTWFRENLGLRPEDFPVAESIGRRTLSLPLYPKLQDDEISHVCDSLRRVAEKLA